MTITTEIRSAVRHGNGVTTIFPFSFRTFNAGHIQVTLIDATGTEILLDPALYSIALSATGGNVTYPVSGSPLAAGSSLLIKRTVPLTQSTDLTNQGPFFAQTHEDAFDYGIMVDQQQQASIDRSIIVPVGEIGITLPSISERAGKLLSFNASGVPEADVATAPVAALAGMVGAIATLAGISDDIMLVAENDIDISILAAIAPAIEQLASGDVVLTDFSAITNKPTTLAGYGIIVPSSYSALKALSPSAGDMHFVPFRSVEGDTGGGQFTYHAGDFTEQVTADTLEGVYVSVNADPTGADGVFIRDFDGPVSIDWYTTGTDGERASSAARVARSFDRREVAIGDREYDFTGATDDVHDVNFIGAGTIINGGRVRAFPVDTARNFVMTSGIVPDRHLRQLAKSPEPTLAIVGDSLATDFAVSGDDPIDSLSGHLRDSFRKSNAGKDITYLNRGVGGARYADISGRAAVIPSSTNWQRFEEVVSTAATGATVLNVDSTAGIRVGDYGLGDGMSATTRVVAINSSTQLTISNALTAAHAATSVSFLAPWLDQVFEESVDTLFLSSGMNDGSDGGWQRFAITGSVIHSVLDQVARAAKRPDLVLVTNNLPTVKGGNASFVSDASQEARAGVAGLIRSYAQFYDIGLIDVNRVFTVLRDGFDPMDLHYNRETLNASQPWPITGEPALGYISVVEFDNIPANFWDLEFDLSQRVGNTAHIEVINGKLAVRWNDSVAIAGDAFVSDIDAPPAGSDVTIYRRINNNYLDIEVQVRTGGAQTFIGNGSIYSGPIIKGGANIDPTLRHAGTAPTITGLHSYYAGVPKLYLPQLFDDEIYNQVPDGTSGGNTVNHADNDSSDEIYTRALEFQNAGVAVLTPPRLGDTALEHLDGYDGLSVDFKKREWAKSDGGVITVGELSSLLEVTGGGALPGLYLDPLSGEPAGLRLVAGTPSVNIPAASIPFNTAAGTVMLDFMVDNDNSSAVPLHVGASPGSSRIQFFVSGDAVAFDDDTVRILLVDGGASVNATHVCQPFDEITRAAITWDGASASSFANGIRGLLDTSVTVPSLDSTFRLANTGGTTTPDTVVLSRLVYIDRKIPSSKLMRSGK